MQHKKFIWLVLVLLLAASLASCNIGKAPEPTPDVNAIYTAAAGTAAAQISGQMTQTAQAIPPTSLPTQTLAALPTLPLSAGATPFGSAGTPFVFNTPAAGALPTATKVPSGAGTGSTAVGCNNAAFLSETIPDGTEITAGKSFQKVWQFQNSGTCAWDDGYAFVFVSGDQMDGSNVTFHKSADFVAAGHGTSFIVHMVAPTKAGTYKGFWQMKDDKGTAFGPRVWVQIVVK